MPSTKELRTRITSVKNTQQTTRAMKMVAAAKLNRAKSAILNARPYALGIESVVKSVSSAQAIDHKFTKEKEATGKVLYVVVSSDRGLCGGFNAKISKYSYLKWINDKKDQNIDLLFVGKKAEVYFRSRGLENKLDIVENLVSDCSYSYSAKFTERLIKLYEEEGYEKVILFYNEFVSALSQEPKEVQLLPIQFHEEVETEELNKDYIFKPAASQIVDQLLHKYLNTQVFRAFLESLASEHAARMNSMESATKNAGEIINTLTLTYNKMRQAAITTELIEITSGAEALKN